MDCHNFLKTWQDSNNFTPTWRHLRFDLEPCYSFLSNKSCMCILRKNPTSQTVSPHCKYQQQNFLLTTRAENKYISPFNLEHGCKACVKSFHTRKYFNSIHFSFAYLYLQINYITFCVETPCITNWTYSLFNQYHLHVDDTRPVNLNPLF